MYNVCIVSKSFTEKTIQSFDGTKIFYSIDNSPNSQCFLFFIHGFGGDLSAWDEIRSDISKSGYNTVAIDLRGHGFSERPLTDESYQVDCFVSDILAVCKVENIKAPVVIGHCFGGMIALLLAAKHPTAAKALTLVSTDFKTPYLSKIVAHNSFLRFMLNKVKAYVPNYHIYGHTHIAKFKNNDDLYWRRVMSDIAHVSLKSYLMISETLCEFDATQLLDRITIPTLIIEGLEDSIVPPEIAYTLHHKIKYSKLALLPNHNHITVIKDPQDLLISLQVFLHAYSKLNTL